jgi:hypothetical protein
MSEAKHVYQAINAVTAAMAKEGIAKGSKNEQQGYRFRGIDEVYNALSVHLANHNLCILPRVLDRAVSERPTKSGGVSTYVVLTVEFDLVSSVDGSSHVIRTMGEAMDTADKATNKAMSAAMKYACLMAFQIPTEGDNDADAHHPEKVSTNDKVRPLKSASDEAEARIAQAFRDAATSEAFGSADADAVKAVNAGQLSDAARARLRQERATALQRLVGAAS